jgi:hypothetical protein
MKFNLKRGLLNMTTDLHEWTAGEEHFAERQ